MQTLLSYMRQHELVPDLLSQNFLQLSAWHGTAQSHSFSTQEVLWWQARGQLSQLTSSHTRARVIQACAKHGSEEDRSALLQEILPNLLGPGQKPLWPFHCRQAH